MVFFFFFVFFVAGYRYKPGQTRWIGANAGGGEKGDVGEKEEVWRNGVKECGAVGMEEGTKLERL